MQNPSDLEVNPVGKNKNGILKPTLALLILCLAVALLLSSVNMLTKDKIEHNKTLKTNEAIASLFQGTFDSFEELTEGFTYVGSADALYKVYDAGHILQGFVCRATPTGFGGDIGLLVAMDKNATVIGVKVLYSTETAGVGSKVTEDRYLEQYANKSGKLVLNEDIDAITGATISSKNVLTGVNDSMTTCRSLLGLEVAQ